MTNPNQSLGNVLSAMQGNNMSFTTIQPQWEYKQTEKLIDNEANGPQRLFFFSSFLSKPERTFFTNATSW